MREMGTGDVIVAASVGAATAVLLFLGTNLAMEKGAYCITADHHCVREWVSALSGWAGAAAALIAIPVLIRTLAVTRRSAEQQLRAYVFVRSAQIEPVYDKYVIKVVVENSGSTPASSLKAHFRIHVGPTLYDPHDDDCYDWGDLAPGSKRLTVIDELYPEFGDRIGSIRDATEKCWLHGYLKYSDTFGNKRKTDFQFVVAAEPNGIFSTELLVDGIANRST